MMRRVLFIAVALVSGCAAVSVHPKPRYLSEVDLQREEDDDGKKAAVVPCEDPDLASEPWKAAEEDLNKQLSTLQASLAEVKKGLDNCEKEKADLNNEIATKKAALQELVEKKDDCKRRLADLDITIKDREQQKRDLEQERDKIKGNIEKLQDKKIELAQMLRIEKRKLREAEEERDVSKDKLKRCEEHKIKRENQKKALETDKATAIDVNGRLKQDLKEKEEELSKCLDEKVKLQADCVSRQLKLRKEINALMPLPDRYDLQDRLDQCVGNVTSMKNKVYYCKESSFEITPDVSKESQLQHVCGYKLDVCHTQLRRYKEAKIVDCDSSTEEGKLLCSRIRNSQKETEPAAQLERMQPSVHVNQPTNRHGIGYVDSVTRWAEVIDF